MYFALPKARISSKMTGSKNNPTVNHILLSKLFDNKSMANDKDNVNEGNTKQKYPQPRLTDNSKKY